MKQRREYLRYGEIIGEATERKKDRSGSGTERLVRLEMMDYKGSVEEVEYAISQYDGSSSCRETYAKNVFPAPANTDI